MPVTVPWPTETLERASAVTALKAELSSVNALTDDQIDRLARMASERVQGYAPDAPASSKEISLLRYISYMVSMPNGALTKLTLGTVTTEFRHSSSNAWVLSGAASVVATYRKHTAGLIGAGTETPDDEQDEELTMRQTLANIGITETPVNIILDLDDGVYEFQKSPGSLEATTVIYAFGPSAPADTDDYFILADDERITFNTAAGTWLRTLIPGTTATISIASI